MHGGPATHFRLRRRRLDPPSSPKRNSTCAPAQLRRALENLSALKAAVGQESLFHRTPDSLQYRHSSDGRRSGERTNRRTSSHATVEMGRRRDRRGGSHRHRNRPLFADDAVEAKTAGYRRGLGPQTLAAGRSSGGCRFVRSEKGFGLGRAGKPFRARCRTSRRLDISCWARWTFSTGGKSRPWFTAAMDTSSTYLNAPQPRRRRRSTQLSDPGLFR